MSLVENSSTPLLILIVRAVTYCRKFDLPVDFELINDSEFHLSTIGFTEQHIHRMNWRFNRDYSEMMKNNKPISRVSEEKLIIEVNPFYDLNKFEED
jgi:hypothetical protein